MTLLLYMYIVQSHRQSCYRKLSLRGQGQGQDFFLKAKAKDVKIVQGQHQGQLSQLPSRAKMCIAVTEIYA